MTTAVSQLRDSGPVRGFSLVELIVAITVATILLAMAVPSFVSVLQKNRIESTAEQLYVSLAEARGEALKRRSDVRVCPVNSDCLRADPISCSCRNDGDWSDGWLIYDTADAQPLTEGEIVKAVPDTSLDTGVSLGSESGVEDFVEFGASGTTIDSGTAGSFWICHSNSSVPSRQIGVSLNGRIDKTERVQTDCGATITEEPEES